jgi:hypothetical protein
LSAKKPADLKSKNLCACRFLFELSLASLSIPVWVSPSWSRALSDKIFPPQLRTFEESQVESPEHQDNANIHQQPFPESVSEEREIYADYNGYHRRHVKHDSRLSAHFRYLSATPLSALVRRPACGTLHLTFQVILRRWFKSLI